jgi:hypothetical protein
MFNTYIFKIRWAGTVLLETVSKDRAYREVNALIRKGFFGAYVDRELGSVL